MTLQHRPVKSLLSKKDRLIVSASGFVALTENRWGWRFQDQVGDKAPQFWTNNGSKVEIYRMQAYMCLLRSKLHLAQLVTFIIAA